MGRVPERDLTLLHDLEQRRLHHRGRAVDLVREQEVAEDGAELGVERRVVGAVDARPDEVGRDEIGRELVRLNVPPSTLAVVFTVSVFASPGTPSIKRWPPVSKQISTRSSI